VTDVVVVVVVFDDDDDDDDDDDSSVSADSRFIGMVGCIKWQIAFGVRMIEMSSCSVKLSWTVY
jgi:hypothetical protein